MEPTPNNQPPKSKIDSLEEKLYSPNVKFNEKPRKELKEKDYGVTQEWPGGVDPTQDEDVEENTGMSIFTKIALVAFVFFLGALAYGGYVLYTGLPSSDGGNVDITVISPVSVGGGEELSLDIIIQNNNQVPLSLVDLVIEYPDGTKSTEDLRTDVTRDREGLGVIEAGSIVRRTKSVALFGEEGDEKEIEVRLEYRTEDSNAVYEKKKIFDVVLQSSPIRLIVDSVKEINPDQTITFNIDVISNSNKKLENIIVEAQYPFGFRLLDSNQETSGGNNNWNLGSLGPKEKKRLTISGILEGQDNEERIFKFNSGIADLEEPDKLAVLFTTFVQAVFIKRPFLQINVTLDGSSDALVVRNERQSVSGIVTYVNNTPTNLNDVKVKIKLDGEVLNESGVQVTGGYYNSIENTIEWDKSTNPNLEEVVTGRSGSLAFSVISQNLANQTKLFRNPEIILDAEVSGRRISENDVPEEITNKTIRTIRFMSVVDVDTSVQYLSGPLPPQAEKETSYTINWKLKNSSNKLTNGKMVATLPNYVSWNNIVSPSSEKVSFDPVSRQVTWNVGSVSEHTGYTLADREISFQVILLPSISQIGQSPVLVTNPTFTAIDTFTDKSISAPKGSQTTEQIGGNENNSNVIGNQ